MAGPGGGPPRKSHTKSRKGCKTCKRRHIRCDETYPQCRNCTKHSCRCDYMDQPPPVDDMPKMPTGPNLLWTPNAEAEIDNWIRTGIYPFPELGLHYIDQFNSLNKVDRRLVHHISCIYRDLQHKGQLPCTAWVDKLPIFLDLTSGHDFVMSAILAFSATNLAAETKSVETRNLAYHHRGIALNGLHMAIGNFSEANSDPILAASILLSWQASDWAGWTSLMSGITSVLSSMTNWKISSVLAEFVERHVQSQERDPLFGMPPPMGGGMGGMMAPMLPEDDQSLQEGLNALHHLAPYVQRDPTLNQFVQELIANATEIEECSRTMRDEQLFDKLQPMRMRLMWVPIHLVQAMKNTDLNFLAVAHLYGIAMAIDASLPELKGAAFGALVTAPLEDIDRRLRFTSPQSYESTSAIEDLMNFPRHIAGRTRQARGSVDAMMAADLNAGSGSPYSFHGLTLDSGPTTPAFPPSYPTFMGNISTEDLNLSVPPSPFLNSFVSTGSRRHSGLMERAGSRPNSMNFDRRSFSGFSGIGPGDSPAYSPQAYSPVPSHYLEDDHLSLPGDQSGSWAYSPGLPYDESSDKGKDRALSWTGTPPHM